MHTINQYDYLEQVTAEQLDQILAQGWRHFGTYFFRYSHSFLPDHEQYATVLPLRIALANFSFSKSQKKILQKNQDLSVSVAPAYISSEVNELFEKHKLRFKDNIPSSIYTFVSEKPATRPCSCLGISVYKGKDLLAYSLLDIGSYACSSVYAFFDTDFSKRSLGIYTMLLEIIWAKENNKKYYYHGYAYDLTSFYDYKKRFANLFYFDWEQSNWLALKN